jgi:SPIRAL1-like protein
MSRGGSSGGGRSSLGYLFEPEEITSYHSAKSNQETKNTSESSSSTPVTKDEKMTACETDQDELPVVIPSPEKKEVSNPIVSSHRPCNIYHTSQLSHNSGLLITVSACLHIIPLFAIHMNTHTLHFIYVDLRYIWNNIF